MTLVGVQDFLFRGRQGLRPQEILCSGGLALANDLTVAFQGGSKSAALQENTRSRRFQT